MLPNKDFFRKYAEEKRIPHRDRDILKEYLQTHILKALSLSSYDDALSFLGGTCLRFAHGIDRFSEDLDFDLVKKKGFSIHKLQKELVRNIELSGFNLDTKVKTTANIHIIYFKFKDVLQEFGFKVSKDEKFLIKFEIDFSPYKNIHTEMKLVDSFNEKFPIVVNTLETLFAQKVLALFLRPYQKGRDFYDLIWFLAQKNLEPEYKIFKEKGYNIKNKQELIAEMKRVVSKLNLKQAARDVEPFLFNPEKAKWIERFDKYLTDL